MEINFFEGFKMGVDLLWTVLTADPELMVNLLIIFCGLLLIAFIGKFIRERIQR
ncbi:hypothetical protein M3649_01780 [Ureibacillus chungkukjangi]|uniref:hypothetical protein n=1 Tax=Ureibacillus chungkukjangi TaxID=1202712 RepID=UPI0020424F61|nr:hypothetical protein [Ureibacillus chungkukjangi]MCM3386858.1 hypothetical protein [Ureibacillus chungkukjangi]